MIVQIVHKKNLKLTLLVKGNQSSVFKTYFTWKISNLIKKHQLLMKILVMQ